jgi:hypothetical protein
VIRQYTVNIWCIAPSSLTTGKHARPWADCPYTDRYSDSAEFFSKSGEIAASPYTDSRAFFRPRAEKFLSRSIISVLVVQKINVNKLTNVADSTHDSRPSKPISLVSHADENLIPYHNETTFLPLKSKNRILDRQKNVFDGDSR